MSQLTPMSVRWKSLSLPAVLAIAAISGLITGCNDAVSSEAQSQITPVKLIEVPDLSANPEDRFIAKIEATHRASLSFQVGGKIDVIYVKMGDYVSKGQVIARLDNADYQYARDARQAEFELAKTHFERSQTLVKRKLISADAFEQAETNFKAARVALNQAEIELHHTRIVAPFNGLISLSHAKAHQVVGANQSIVSLIDTNSMDVSFSLPVRYVEQYGLSHLKQAPLSVTMDTHRDTRILASFKEISTRPNTDTNSYTAKVTIKTPPSMNLLTDMTGEVNIPSPEPVRHYRIAETAWITKETHTGHVWRFDPKTQMIHNTEVTLDAAGNVTAGLKRGDFIVQAGGNKLVEGQVVRPWTKEGGI
ncbi:efflux RND transporter periplasmic adaptor subunit [Vibrio agarivorans]|uniref:Efflux RND transporter periplasmic adaptor subunit n=1 Tax=Vibrio agarivorans TaxID=153622 RepID=A0ABT7Y069_9VIBR|nr:efflux RND transporter periplasmic adaptor subunit [Vibrio agarivorans]MDN2481432.1 efflux RND transporter periplasmic adaptor subunit [Vibrio agarivorans]